MQFDDFRYIIMIAELESLTAAARQLYIAQPSLSQHIRQIELQYGIILFQRLPHGVKLTEEGEAFLRFARDVVDRESLFRKELTEIQIERGGKE